MAALRELIYTRFAGGEAVSLAALAEALDVPLDRVRVGVRELAEGRALVLQPDGEILMAEPFSAVPTAFVVRSGGREWWGNCIWDALGIPAMLGIDAVLETSCQCCGASLRIRTGRVGTASGTGVAHFAVPARLWWRDVVYT